MRPTIYQRSMVEYWGFWIGPIFVGVGYLPKWARLRASWGGYPSAKLQDLAYEIMAECSRVGIK